MQGRGCVRALIQLSLSLQADIAVLDEIDSGLDIDALRDVADAVNSLKRPNSATLMVTHYKVIFWPFHLDHPMLTPCNTRALQEIESRRASAML